MIPGVIPVSLVYLGYFAALGAFWPYYGPLLVSFGLSRGAATQVMAIGPVFGFLAPPLVGLLADALRARALLVRLLSGGAVVAFTGFFVAAGRTWLVVATVVLFSACRSPLVPLVDASALAVARAGGAGYGRMRLWGSLGFLGAALLAGELTARGGPARVLPLALSLLATAAVATWFIPSPPGERTPVLRAWLEGLGRRDTWLFLAATALGASAHGLYDAGFSLHLADLGLGGRFVGVAWATGVAFEVALLAASSHLLARVPAERLLTIAFAVAGGRWVLLATLTSPVAILGSQPLHAITFGLCWVSGVTVAQASGSARAPAATQGLYAAAVGVGSFTGMSLAGRLLGTVGGRGMFLVAAALSAAAVLAMTLRGRSRA